MANYSIVSNARFTPFSFDQMVKPFQMYGEYYAQQEQLASSLAEEAAEWGQKANETTDPITYQKYKSFEADLNRQSDRLLRQGLTPGLRADLQKMRKRYAKEINPIKDAYNWKLQQIQQQAEGRAKGIVYAGDAATTSLDDYIANPTLIYSAADSNAGYARVANAAQAIAKGLSEAKISGKLDDYTKALLIRSGYDANDVTNSVNQAMSDLQGVLNGTISMNSKAGKVVQELLQNESRASGIGDWKSMSAKQEYLSKVSPALYNLIGQSTTTPMEDFKTRTDLQGSWQSRHIAEQGEQTRKNQSHAAALSEAAAEKAHSRQMRLLKEKAKLFPGARTPGQSGSSNSKRNSGGTEYGYDRPNVYFSNGNTNQITKTSEGALQIEGKNIKDYTRLTIKRSTYNPNDISIYNGSRLLASYNASSSNKSSGIRYYDPSTNKYVARHGGAKLNGTLKGLTATDIRNFARFVAENPGSENQYSYGITKDGQLFSVQNSAQRVTKGLDNSAAMMQALWSDMGYSTGVDYGSYGQDADLNLW